MAKTLKVLIAGAGIGGLTAALCCVYRGLDVQVFERAAELREVGAGIQLPPNAMRVFEKLGLADKLGAVSFAPQALEARMGIDGRRVFSVPITGQPWGAPYLNIHRADYIDILKTALIDRAPDSLTLGASVNHYQNTDGGITLTQDDGAEYTGDILIGADGIHSAVRTQMLGEDPAQFTGNVAWRAVVPMEAVKAALPPTSCVWFGRGAHAVTYPLRGGTLANFVGVIEIDDWTIESWSERGGKDEALSDFANWDPRITAVLSAAAPDQLFRWGLHDRPPLRAWTDGRAALLGDAAHPMLPFMAQGAAMAVEDGWILADELTRAAASVSAALSNYEMRRKPRASMVQAASRANRKTFHRRSALSQVATYGPMWLAGSYAPSLIRRRLSRFYAHDVTRN